MLFIVAAAGFVLLAAALPPAQQVRRIITCLMAGGTDVPQLQLHLNATQSSTAAWVVVEAELTTSGEPRALLDDTFARLQATYGPERLVRVVVPAADMTARNGTSGPGLGSGTRFKNEAYQRSQCIRGLRELHLKPWDQVLVLDPDEIPHPRQLVALQAVKPPVGNRSTILPMDMFHYDTSCPTAAWGAATATAWATVERFFRVWPARWAFQLRTRHPRISTRVTPRGWHLTYFQTDRDIGRKVRHFAHREHSTKAVMAPALIVERVAGGCDPLMRPDAPCACSRTASGVFPPELLDMV